MPQWHLLTRRYKWCLFQNEFNSARGLRAKCNDPLIWPPPCSWCIWWQTSQLNEKLLERNCWVYFSRPVSHLFSLGEKTLLTRWHDTSENKMAKKALKSPEPSILWHVLARQPVPSRAVPCRVFDYACRRIFVRAACREGGVGGDGGGEGDGKTKSNICRAGCKSVLNWSAPPAGDGLPAPATSGTRSATLRPAGCGVENQINNCGKGKNCVLPPAGC